MKLRKGNIQNRKMIMMIWIVILIYFSILRRMTFFKRNQSKNLLEFCKYRILIPCSRDSI